MAQILDWRTDAILRLPQVRRLTGLSRSSIYALQGNHHFPHSIQLTPHAVGWLESEVRAWLIARIQARGAGQIFDEVRPAREILGKERREKFG